MEEYLAKEKEVHEEFGTFLKKHAVKDLGCEEECVNGCVNRDYITFWEMPECLQYCRCEQTVLKMDHGRYNYASLMSYN